MRKTICEREGHRFKQLLGYDNKPINRHDNEKDKDYLLVYCEKCGTVKKLYEG